MPTNAIPPRRLSRNVFLVVLAVCPLFLVVPSKAHSASIDARLSSCDPAVVQAAVDEVLRDPATLREPLQLILAAQAQLIVGRDEEAAFLYLAGRTRGVRQALFEKGDRAQLLAIMIGTLGPVVMPVLEREADRDMARRVVKRVIAWDRSTPDPYRDREEAKTGEMRQKLADIDAGLARLPDEIRKQPAPRNDVRAANQMGKLMIASAREERCGPGRVDAVDLDAATKQIKTQAESLARTHPSVRGRAGGPVESVFADASQRGASRLPSRLSVHVYPLRGKPFFAEVDAEVVVTADRKLESFKVSLACVTDLSRGERDTRWKDVCLEDPKAIRPN